MDSQSVTEMSERYLMRTYRRAPIAFASGQGARLVDLEGKTYLDFVAGIAVTVLGHNHPAVTAAIRGQAARLLHVSNLYQIPQQAELAWWLVHHTGLARAFFCNSGAEANEAAIKLARKWGRTRGDGRFQIIVAEHSFHGRTLGSLAATAQPAYQRGFEPLPAGFVAVPFNDLGALQDAVTPDVCAVMLEPVQGEGGIHVAAAEGRGAGGPDHDPIGRPGATRGHGRRLPTRTAACSGLPAFGDCERTRAGADGRR